MLTRFTRRRHQALILSCLFGGVFLFSSCAGGGKSVATTPLEAEANEMIDVLRENQIEAEKTGVTEEGATRWNIQVREGWLKGGQASQAIRVLRENGLPRPPEQGLETATSGSGLIESESAQKARRLKEQKTEIERHLRSLPGVTRVSVNIAPPEDNPLAIDRFPGGASVIVLYKNQKPPYTVEELREMVAVSVTGLKPERVSVKMLFQATHPANAEKTVGGGNGGPAPIASAASGAKPSVSLSGMAFAMLGGGLVILMTTSFLLWLRGRQNLSAAIVGPDFAAGSSVNLGAGDAPRGWFDGEEKIAPEDRQ